MQKESLDSLIREGDVIRTEDELFVYLGRRSGKYIVDYLKDKKRYAVDLSESETLFSMPLASGQIEFGSKIYTSILGFLHDNYETIVQAVDSKLDIGFEPNIGEPFKLRIKQELGEKKVEYEVYSLHVEVILKKGKNETLIGHSGDFKTAQQIANDYSKST